MVRERHARGTCLARTVARLIWRPPTRPDLEAGAARLPADPWTAWARCSGAAHEVAAIHVGRPRYRVDEDAQSAVRTASLDGISRVRRATPSALERLLRLTGRRTAVTYLRTLGGLKESGGRQQAEDRRADGRAWEASPLTRPATAAPDVDDLAAPDRQELVADIVDDEELVAMALRLRLPPFQVALLPVAEAERLLGAQERSLVERPDLPPVLEHRELRCRWSKRLKPCAASRSRVQVVYRSSRALGGQKREVSVAARDTRQTLREKARAKERRFGL